jgi:hypothetical protein
MMAGAVANTRNGGEAQAQVTEPLHLQWQSRHMLPANTGYMCHSTFNSFNLQHKDKQTSRHFASINDRMAPGHD